MAAGDSGAAGRGGRWGARGWAREGQHGQGKVVAVVAQLDRVGGGLATCATVTVATARWQQHHSGYDKRPWPRRLVSRCKVERGRRRLSRWGRWVARGWPGRMEHGTAELGAGILGRRKLRSKKREWGSRAEGARGRAEPQPPLERDRRGRVARVVVWHSSGRHDQARPRNSSVHVTVTADTNRTRAKVDEHEV
jgi:hypothetical protein